MNRWISAWFAFFVALAFGPATAAAFWGPDGQCGEEPLIASSLESSDDGTDCNTVTDPSDPSYNACYEQAEHPISALPEIVTQGQAEDVAGSLVAVVHAKTDVQTAPLPSADEASVADPGQPQREFVAPVRRHRPTPSSCTFTPDDCERAPAIPNLNLEGSAAGADGPELEVELDEPPIVTDRRKAEGRLIQQARGFRDRLDRPPQVL